MLEGTFHHLTITEMEILCRTEKASFIILDTGHYHEGAEEFIHFCWKAHKDTPKGEPPRLIYMPNEVKPEPLVQFFRPEENEEDE